jgi:hypothetical protein
MLVVLAVLMLLVGGVTALADNAKLVALVASVRSHVPAIGIRQVIGGAIVVMAVALLVSGATMDAEPPTPTPVPSGPLDLHGKFNGPTAAGDAAILGGICGELAAIIEHDASEAGGHKFKTAAQVDEWRRTMREFRCRGESVGARQPAARDAIGEFLTNTVGDSPAELTPASRASWIGALRDISRACNDAAK